MSNVFYNSTSVSRASILLAFVFLLTTEAIGQQKGVEPNRLAVDTVSIRKLGRIHGIVLDENATSISIVVRRTWLEKSFPDFAKEHFANEEKTIVSDRQTLKRRLESWQGNYENEDRKVINDFVDENVKLLGLNETVDLSKLQFTIVKLDPKLVRRTFRQGQERHLLAGIAWSEKIENVETTNASALKRMLEKQEVDIEKYDLSLGSEIPMSLESDEDWESRKSLMEFGLLSRVEYQGSNGLFLRRGADLNAGDALNAMLQGGGLGGLGGVGGFSHVDRLGKELGLPEFQDRNRKGQRDENAWLKPMIETAEKENRRCFSVSKMTQGQTVTIEMQLYHKVANNQWVPLATFTNSESIANQTQDDIDIVAQDPNVSKVMKMAGQLGFADPSILEMALKSGSATKKALSKSMSELDEFVEQYSFEVDNPPIEKRR